MSVSSCKTIFLNCSIVLCNISNGSMSPVRTYKSATDAPEPVRLPLHFRTRPRLCRKYLTHLTRYFCSFRINDEVIVRLKWGQTEYKGKLVSVDSYMNIQLLDTEEFIDGKSTG